MSFVDRIRLTRALGIPIGQPGEAGKMSEPKIFRGLRKAAREVGFHVQRDRRGRYELIEGKTVVGPLDLEDLARAMMKRRIIAFGGADAIQSLSDRKRRRG